MSLFSHIRQISDIDIDIYFHRDQLWLSIKKLNLGNVISCFRCR